MKKLTEIIFKIILGNVPCYASHNIRNKFSISRTVIKARLFFKNLLNLSQIKTNATANLLIKIKT